MLGDMARPCKLPAALPFLLAAVLAGCIHQPTMIPPQKQQIIDHTYVEYPSGCALVMLVDGLNCPTCLAVDEDGSLIVAESGINGAEPHIFGYRRNGTYFKIYPYYRTVSFFPGGFVLYGPISGMVARQGKIYVSHRQRDGYGCITALGYDGTHSTVKANLPARGDYGVTDLAIGPTDGRLYFGVGTATNSGVVGLDNWDEGWLKDYPDVHDLPYIPGPNSNLILLGRRFDTPNPRYGMFSGADILVTAPFQPFGISNQTSIPSSETPNGCICSINPDGGDFQVEAYGLHNPRGLGFDENGQLYITNDGMELRGTRPVKNDPDSILKFYRTNYGWPDYTTDCKDVSGPDYQPGADMMLPSGYPDLSPLIDQKRSGLLPPSARDLVVGVFKPLAGAAKFAFAPASGPFKSISGNIIVALRWRSRPLRHQRAGHAGAQRFQNRHGRPRNPRGEGFHSQHGGRSAQQASLRQHRIGTADRRESRRGRLTLHPGLWANGKQRRRAQLPSGHRSHLQAVGCSSDVALGSV